MTKPPPLMGSARTAESERSVQSRIKPDAQRIRFDTVRTDLMTDVRRYLCQVWGCKDLVSKSLNEGFRD
jgi:hypothetical protein